MKRFIKTTIYLFAACTVFLLSNCKKVSDIPQPPLVDSNIVNAMYPAVQSFYDGSQSAYPTVYSYQYDKDNQLIKYGQDNLYTREISANAVAESTYDLGLDIVATMNYAFSMVGQTNTAVNIYTASPNQVGMTLISKNLKTGVTWSEPAVFWQFEYNNKGQLLREITSGDRGVNYDFSYDDNGNFKEIDDVKLTGPRAGAVYSKLKVISLDNKPSPFSHVKGYWAALWPQGHAEDFAGAFCKNNPIQMTNERYDPTKNAFVMDEKDDFTYMYNDKGYPTQITVNTTYYNAIATTTTHYTRTYNYTYK